MTYPKQRLAAVLASSKGKAMIEEGQQFSIEELQAAFAEFVLGVRLLDRSRRGVEVTRYGAALLKWSAAAR